MSYALREALAALRRAPILSFLSAAMVALALLVVGLFALVSYNLHEALSRVEERVEVIAYVRDDATPEEINAARESLLELEEVRDVRHITKAAALDAARADLPEFQEMFSGLEVNPLPASLEVELHPGFRTPESVARVAGIASLYPFLEEISYGQEWVDRIYVLRGLGAMATSILGIGFSVVAALIIATAVRIAVFAREDEIRVMRLVGATDWFIRRPFLLEGFLTGLTGAVAAVAITYLVYQVSYRMIFPLEWIPWLWMFGGVLAGGLLGTLASALALGRYLREV